MGKAEADVSETANRLREVMHQAVELEAKLERDSRRLDRIATEYVAMQAQNGWAELRLKWAARSRKQLNS